MIPLSSKGKNQFAFDNDQNRQKHVSLSVIFYCTKNCRLGNTAHLKDAVKKKKSISELWIGPVGQCQGKVCPEAAQGDLGS